MRRRTHHYNCCALCGFPQRLRVCAPLFVVCVQDIKSETLSGEQLGFKLTFTFAENPFFSNSERRRFLGSAV